MNYQWNAATAGTGGTITNANATGSVCPKGWKLPNASSAFDNTKGSFYYMLSQYGVQSNLSGTSPVNNNTYNIALSPLFFVRSGRIYEGSTSTAIDVLLIDSAGRNGYGWSSRASSDTINAYDLYFSSSSVNPSDYYYVARYVGRSLRCLISTP